MKGLSLEQIDRMLEETNARHSAKWVPHSTFAEDMGLTAKGMSIGVTGDHVEHIQAANEKVANENAASGTAV